MVEGRGRIEMVLVLGLVFRDENLEGSAAESDETGGKRGAKELKLEN